MKYFAIVKNKNKIAHIWDHDKHITKCGRYEDRNIEHESHAMFDIIGDYKVCELCAKKESVLHKFCQSQEWLELRYKFILKHKAACMCCGRTPKEDGVSIHVDHIKPKSKYPDLRLVESNLQILCKDCNFGKSNIDETDWR